MDRFSRAIVPVVIVLITADSVLAIIQLGSIEPTMQWLYAQVSNEIPDKEPLPTTAIGIWLRLRELGNWRARSITFKSF